MAFSFSDYVVSDDGVISEDYIWKDEEGNGSGLPKDITAGIRETGKPQVDKLA